MAYEKSSIQEMYEDWQKDAVPHIQAIMRFAYHKNFPDGLFVPNPKVLGEWWPADRSGTRDRNRIRFSPDIRIIKDEKTIGDEIPVGEQKNLEASIVDRSEELPEGVELQPVEEALLTATDFVEEKYAVGTDSEHQETRGSLFGWDFENSIESNTTIGGDASPVKQEIKVGIKWGVHGEKSKQSGDTYGQNSQRENTTHVALPFGYHTKLTQTQQSGQVDIPVTHNLIFDMVFGVTADRGAIDLGYHKHGWQENRRYFSGSPDNTDVDGLRYVKFICQITDANDFRLMMTGGNRRFPHVPKNSFQHWEQNREHYNWLIDESKRTGVVRVVDRYNNAFFDNGKITRTPRKIGAFMKRLLFVILLSIGLAGFSYAGPMTQGIKFTGGKIEPSNLVLERSHDFVADDGVLKLHIAISQFKDLKGYSFVLDYDHAKYTFMGEEFSDDYGESVLFLVSDKTPGQIVVGAMNVGDSPVSNKSILVGLLFSANRKPLTSDFQIREGMLVDLFGGIDAITDVKMGNFEPVTKNHVLSQNAPNPFNPSTTIEYQLSEPTEIRLVIYNLLGQEILTLIDDSQDVGVHSVVWDGKDNAGNHMSSGLYLYRMTAGKFSQVKRMVLLK